MAECSFLSELSGKKKDYEVLSWGSGPLLPNVHNIIGPYTHEGGCQQHRTILTALKRSMAIPRVLACTKASKREEQRAASHWAKEEPLNPADSMETILPPESGQGPGDNLHSALDFE